MKYVDIHCHLDFEQFDEDRETLMETMRQEGIIAYANTMNPESYARTKELFAAHHDVVKVAAGLYPQEAEQITDAAMEAYKERIRKDADNIIALGEVGLDKHHTTDEDAFAVQMKRFREMVELAREMDKPLIIHSRKAEPETLDIIEEFVHETGFRRFDLHCFSGRKKHIKRIKELGIYCSIPLVVQNTESFQILVNELPVRQLLVETDSPFLHPDKIRNSPLSVPLIYQYIAEVKGYDTQEIRSIIYRNIQRFTL